MMNDDSASEEDSNPHTQRVGRRLAIIREELSQLLLDHDWSQTGVGRRVGLTQNIITRMEHGKGGLIENWLKVLNFYEAYGYNLNWIVTEDNQRISKLLINESTAGRIRDEVLTKLAVMRENTLQGIDDLYKAVDELTSKGDSPKRPKRPKANTDHNLSFLGE